MLRVSGMPIMPDNDPHWLFYLRKSPVQGGVDQHLQTKKKKKKNHLAFAPLTPPARNTAAQNLCIYLTERTFCDQLTVVAYNITPASVTHGTGPQLEF